MLGFFLCDEKRDCISNLRFADDMVMMAASLKKPKKTEAQRLGIHSDKTPNPDKPENKQNRRRRTLRDARGAALS